MPIPLRISPQDKTATAIPMSVYGTDSARKPDAAYAEAGMKPPLKGNMAFPLWEIASDYTGNGLSPAAVAGGAIDIAIAKAPKPYGMPLFVGTRVLNTVPRLYDNDFWKKAGEYQREKTDKLKRNLNANGNRVAQWLTPPIPYLEE